MTPRAPRGDFEPWQLDLVRRQIATWVDNADRVGATADWHPDGFLSAPHGVCVAAADIPAVIRGWHESFTGLRIDLNALFGSRDERWLAIEWVWNVTRRSDGATSTVEDSIIVELRDRRIISWREYFDTHDNVEFET